MPETKPDIRKLSLEQLVAEMKVIGEAAFRARQVYEWLWKLSATSFDQMTNLSKELREKLENKFAIHPITLHKEQHSSDGTIKSSFALYDTHLIEGVMIPTEDRATACVSS